MDASVWAYLISTVCTLYVIVASLKTARKDAEKNDQREAQQQQLEALHDEVQRLRSAGYKAGDIYFMSPADRYKAQAKQESREKAAARRFAALEHEALDGTMIGQHLTDHNLWDHQECPTCTPPAVAPTAPPQPEMKRPIDSVEEIDPEAILHKATMEARERKLEDSYLWELYERQLRDRNLED